MEKDRQYDNCGGKRKLTERQGEIMKKIICFLVCIFCFVSLALALGPNPGTAVTPSIYGITFSKVELHNKDTNTWVTIGEGDAYFDIALANAGATVGDYFSNVELPSGTYDKIRTKISRNIQLKGSGKDGSGVTYYTTANQVANFGTGTVKGKAISASNTVTSPVQGTFQVPGDLPPTPPAGFTRVAIDNDYFTDEIAAPTFTEFTVVKGTPRTMKLSFDVSSTLYFDSGIGPAAYCYPPVVSASMQ